MTLRHGKQEFEHAPSDKPKVAGVVRYVDVGHAANKPIEGSGGSALEQAFAVASATLAVDHIGAPVHQRHHVGQQLGRVLQIGIDDQDALAAAN